MENNERDNKKEFEDFVNSNYESVMDDYWMVVQAFMSSTEDPKYTSFCMGFIMALHWIGEGLGLELAQPDAEAKAKIMECFK